VWVVKVLCVRATHLITVSSSAPALANDHHSNPSALGTKLLCAFASVSPIIAAIVISLLDSLRPNTFYRSLSRTYERKLSAATEAHRLLDPDPTRELATPTPRQRLGAQDLQVHSPHRCVCTSLFIQSDSLVNHTSLLMRR
jgi:hypothetical protein